MSDDIKENLALGAARKAVRIVIFIGMFAVLLVMINIYVLLNQITATAQMSKEIHSMRDKINDLEKNIQK
ncbi:DUF5408 family protein [Helicobacter sp. 11S02596-1]|uniref:DUF5408 family protein n=1 Tax=Helicobacter sp. 11S02596-1 TaxID=1476194 RepID=UPI000BA57609|nr:DUF5408 family protein [Helicobacter sp. 11S02596-1]PAF42477.1 hypothetical protein BJI48_06665 [Helicobacter sp. 11S02596-1]